MRKLDLSNNNLTDDSMPHCLFDDLSYLESLDLSGNNLKNSHHILSGKVGLISIVTYMILCILSLLYSFS